MVFVTRTTLRDFPSIYQEFQPKIHRYLCGLIGEADADDITQAVFLKVSQSLEAFRGESSLATWIYRIATNAAHDHARSSFTKSKELESSLEQADSLEENAGTEQEYIRREMNACIRGIIDQLPENYGAVLLLSKLEEFTNAEIAEILDLSIETVKIRLHRARARLREAMECQCSFYHDERNELMCDRKDKK